MDDHDGDGICRTSDECKISVPFTGKFLVI